MRSRDDAMERNKATSSSSTAMGTEQREFPRVSSRCVIDFRRVDHDTRFDVMRGNSQGLLQNISGGGVRVHMDEDPGAGQLLALTIQLPQMPMSVIALGKVVWSKPAPPGTDVGIEFWWVGWEDPAAQEQIRNYITETLGKDPEADS